MAAKPPVNRAFTEIFELLADQSFARGDDYVDEVLFHIAQEVYKISQDYNYDASLAEESLGVLGVEL